MLKELRKRFILFNMLVIACVLLILFSFIFWGSKSHLSMGQTISTITISLFLALLASSIISKFALNPIRQSWQRQLDFTADASHELRTPLSVMRTSLEIVMDSSEETVESQMKWLKNIEAEQLRMTKLVEDLLTLSRADSGGQALLTTTFLLSELVEKTSDTFLSICQKKEISLAKNIDENIAFTGDEKRIAQLLVILLDNAVHYTDRKEKITVELHRHDKGIALRVQDTGMGMSKTDNKKVFDRFYRSERTRQKNPDGSGLGLPIAKWIVEQHNGKIYVKSELEQGTIFSVIFH